jgi:archaellum component FlaC
MDDKELKELKEKNEKLMASYKEVVRKYNVLLDEYNKTKKMADANLY